MTKLLFTTILILVGSLSVCAQYNTPQNYHWRFGQNAGLDFNTGMPALSPTPTAHNFHGGTAQVSDASGNLLFYTNGMSVYNRLGAIMPNGNTIVSFPTGTGIYSATIVPVIGNPNQYYIFSLERGNIAGLWHGQLAYSIVDMSLDGGMGDILPCVSGIVIDSLFNEMMLTIPGDGCTMWVVCHKRGNLDFCAFPITGSGVGLAVVSTTGTCTTCYGGGGIKASPDGTKITTANLNRLELHDFDPATGIVSGTRLIDTFYGGYDQEFSPDGTKLYANQIDTIPALPGIGHGILVQLDLSLPTPEAIMASHTLIASGLMSSYALKLAPDGKIYFADYDQHFLNCINSPNTAGPACGYTYHAIDLSPNMARVGLPAIYNNYPPGSESCSFVPITPCPTETINIAFTRSLSISPNPGNGIYNLLISSTVTNQPVTITICNITGSRVYESTVLTKALQTSQTLDISKQPAGIYVLTVYANNEQHIVKLIKE